MRHPEKVQSKNRQSRSDRDIAARLRNVLEQAAGREVGAELRDGAELDGMEAELFSSADVLQPVVDEEGFVGADAEVVAGPDVDGGVRLGDAELTGKRLVGELSEPREFLAHVAEHLGAHVGEDGSQKAGFLEGGDPSEHALIDGDPHEDVVFDEGTDLVRREGEAGVAGEIGPPGGAVDVAEIVVATVAPVEALEGVVVEAGEVEKAAVGGRVRHAEDLAIVEDDGANGQRMIPRGGDRWSLSSL